MSTEIKDYNKWQKEDTTWSLALFGTAIGAGVLFFPIRAGYGGLLPILIMLFLAFPIAFYSHRAMARFCLSGKSTSGDITQTVEEHFGKTGGIIMTFMYFFAICPLLWIYGVTMTNTFMSFWTEQLGMAPLGRAWVAFGSLLVLSIVITFGKDMMVKVMSYLVWPFIGCLLIISLLLIPYWNTSVFEAFSNDYSTILGPDGIFNTSDGLINTVWLGIGIMVFSFNFSPIVSSFCVSQRENYEANGGMELVEQKSTKIIRRASILMVSVVMFFAFSNLFALSPENMAEAKEMNIPVLTYLAYHFGGESTLGKIFFYAAPIIALVAIFKSFFGHYLGTLEGLNGLIIRFGYKGDRTKISSAKLNFISMVFIMASTWLVAYLDPNILDLIEQMGAPIIAMLLCLLPMYAINKIPALSRFKGLPSNYFVTAIGVLTILNVLRSFF